ALPGDVDQSRDSTHADSPWSMTDSTTLSSPRSGAGVELPDAPLQPPLEVPREPAVDPENPSGFRADDGLRAVVSEGRQDRVGDRLRRLALVELDLHPPVVAEHVVVQAGLREAGDDQQHVDVEAGHLAAQRLRESAQ